MASDHQPIVFDNSYYTTKIGFAGNDIPDSIFPTIVGEMNNSTTQQITNYVGDNVLLHDDINIIQPIQQEKITNWSAMEAIWRYSFNDKLHTESQESTVLLSDYSTDHKQRENTAQIMFESLNIIQMFFSKHEELSIYSSGRGSGIIVFLGEGITNITPIYEGYSLPYASLTNIITENEIIQYLLKKLNTSGCKFTPFNSMNTINDLLNNYCYVTSDYSHESTKDISQIKKNYTLPDGKTISLGLELFQTPELLFQPSLIGYETIGIHETIYNSIQLSDVEIQETLYCNVILSGELSKLPNLETRLNNELKDMKPIQYRHRVITPPERNMSVWIGGSLLASLSTMDGRWVTREEYDERGSNIFKIKCF